MRRRTKRSIVYAVLAIGCATLAGCSSSDAPGEKITLAVHGMHCEGCAQAIQAAVEAVPGVKSVDVSLKDQRAVIVPAADGLDQQAVIAAIKQAGYEAMPGGAPVAGEEIATKPESKHGPGTRHP
jgi:copper chaperone